MTEVEYQSQPRGYSQAYSRTSSLATKSDLSTNTREYLRLCCQLALNQLERYKELLSQTLV